MIEGEIKVGDVFRYRGNGDADALPFTKVEEFDGDEQRGSVQWSEGAGPSGPWSEPWAGSVRWIRETHDRISAPAPEPSQHPADLKPRGVKAPLHLIPWGAIPAIEQVPPDLAFAAREVGYWPDGDPVISTCPAPAWLFELAAQLIGSSGLEPVARVFEYGAKKYARDNWRTFTWDQAAEDAYYGAIFRHLCADARGETIDPESGQPHRAHAACGALISIWHYRYGTAGRKPAAEARPDV